MPASPQIQKFQAGIADCDFDFAEHEPRVGAVLFLGMLAIMLPYIMLIIALFLLLHWTLP